MFAIASNEGFIGLIKPLKHGSLLSQTPPQWSTGKKTTSRLRAVRNYTNHRPFTYAPSSSTISSLQSSAEHFSTISPRLSVPLLATNLSAQG